MKVLITGICGFVGSTLAGRFREHVEASPLELVGIDNLSRPGSEQNRNRLAAYGVQVLHGDVRSPSDLEPIGPVDWVIDAAANASVLAGVDGRTSSRQLVEHNLYGTVNLLEYCRAVDAGLILLSTSRVYSITGLLDIELTVVDDAYKPVGAGPTYGPAGVSEAFSTDAPVSLYGATKLASEALVLEYHHAYRIPVWVNRCGVLAGAGQFGHPAQGIFSYWIHAHRARRPLRYIGFGGRGHQVRDCLHPADLVPLLVQQFEASPQDTRSRITNVAGGQANSMSLAQLTRWCDDRFGPHLVQPDHHPRPLDLPWLVLDCSAALAAWDWQPATTLPAILDEIACFADDHPDWLPLAGA